MCVSTIHPSRYSLLISAPMALCNYTALGCRETGSIDWAGDVLEGGSIKERGATAAAVGVIKRDLICDSEGEESFDHGLRGSYRLRIVGTFPLSS